MKHIYWYTHQSINCKHFTRAISNPSCLEYGSLILFCIKPLSGTCNPVNYHKVPRLLKNISPAGWDRRSRFKWHLSSFSRNDPRQGHSSSWGWTRELWEIRHRCRRQLFSECPPFGCPQVTRRHRRCQVLIHRPIWVWAGGEGDWQGSCKMWRLAVNLKILLLLLCFIFFLCSLDENWALGHAFLEVHKH